ncbi:MAG: hypothetical protein HN348_16185 [Proteobacteria bacterium]|nr:hypothetical protein [Pseudomonadota bacterium]
MRRIETFDWWQELVDRKDELSLRELAEKFAVTPGAISAAFKRTGTSRKAAPPGPRALRKTKHDDLPPEPGEEAEDVGSLPQTRPGSKDEMIKMHFDSLGKVPDAEVAKKAGVSVRTIASFRARHGIPGYSGPRRTTQARAPRTSKLDPFIELLGTVPDRVVAEKAGVSLNAVRNYRVKRGISAAGRASAVSAVSAPEAPTPQPKPQPVKAMGGGAWLVEVKTAAGEQELVIVGDDIVHAATRAQEANRGDVIGLTYIGEFIG